MFDLAIAPAVMATVHPSSILRAPDEEARREEMTLFVADLKVAAAYIHGHVRRAA
jgi:DNA polymerase